MSAVRYQCLLARSSLRFDSTEKKKSLEAICKESQTLHAFLIHKYFKKMKTGRLFRRFTLTVVCMLMHEVKFLL